MSAYPRTEVATASANALTRRAAERAVIVLLGTPTMEPRAAKVRVD